MAVVFRNASTLVDSSGSPVSTISVPRPGTLASGDFILLWGWVQTTVDWNVSAGLDGVAWTKLWRYDRFQVWGKFLGAGFGSEDTVVGFSAAHPVYGMQQAIYRGGFTISYAGIVSGSGVSSFPAPGVVPAASHCRDIRLFACCPTDANPDPVGLDGPGSFAIRAANDHLGERFESLLIDKAFTGTGSVGTVRVTVNITDPAFRTFKLASGFTLALNDNQPPYAPTLVSPPDHAALRVDIGQTFTWLYNNPEGGSQSRFNFRYSDDSGATWTTVTYSSPNTHIKFAAGTFDAGSNYQWQVRTYDTHGAAGPWSPSRFFSGTDPTTAPSITYPDDGGTVAAIDRVDWSVAAQDDYQVRRVGDDIDGNPDPGTIYFDTGDQIDSLPRTYPLTFPVAGRYEHIQVRVYSLGVWSDWADVRVLADYTPPPVVNLSVSVGDDEITLAVAWTMLAPEDGAPDAITIDLDVSADGGVTVLDDWPSSSGLPTTGTAVYPWPASGVEHCFRATSRADNGATAAGEWISIGRFTVDEVL